MTNSPSVTKAVSILPKMCNKLYGVTNDSKIRCLSLETPEMNIFVKRPGHKCTFLK